MSLSLSLAAVTSLNIHLTNFYFSFKNFFTFYKQQQSLHSREVRKFIFMEIFYYENVCQSKTLKYIQLC